MAALSAENIHELADPAAANVRGFYIAGRQIAVAQGLIATENGRLLVGEA
ncbi:MAG TPA: hypothetical protein VFR86_11670 [Burkholderiaceae bacterium]|nr:hypothetical protein [Burkholderiaceae bacterium]